MDVHVEDTSSVHEYALNASGEKGYQLKAISLETCRWRIVAGYLYEKTISRNQEFFMHLHVDLVNGKRKTKLIFSWYLCKQFSWDPGKGDLPVGDKWKGHKTKDFSPTKFICPTAMRILSWY